MRSGSVEARERHGGKVKGGGTDQCGVPQARADERERRFNTPLGISEPAEGTPLAPPSAHAAAHDLVFRCTLTPRAPGQSRQPRTTPFPAEPTLKVLAPILKPILAPGPALVPAPVPELVLAPVLARVLAVVLAPA